MAAQQLDTGSQNRAATHLHDTKLSDIDISPDAIKGLLISPNRTPTDVIDIGKRLFILKEVTPIGEWKSRIKHIGLSGVLAAKFMAAAFRFLSLGASSTLADTVGTQTKLLELLALDDNELKALDAGDTVRGLHRDKINALTVKDIRAMLRAGGQMSPSMQAKLDAKMLLLGASPIIKTGTADHPAKRSSTTVSSNVALTQSLRGQSATVRHTVPAEFNEASKEFCDRVHDLCRRTHRVSAVLRLMQSHFHNGLGDAAVTINDEDVFELLDLMAETLPHHYDDVNDPLDAYDTAAREEVKEAIGYSDKVSAILAAMTTVARGDATVAEIDEALGEALDIARDDPAFEPDWQSLVDVLATRGYTVEVMEHNGVMMLPHVTTPGLSKLDRKTKRAVGALVRATHAREAANREPATAERGSR